MMARLIRWWSMTKDEHDAAMADRDRPVTQVPIRRHLEQFPDGFGPTSLLDGVIDDAQRRHDLRGRG